VAGVSAVVAGAGAAADAVAAGAGAGAAGASGAAAAAIEVAGLVHVYPEGTRALTGVDLRVAVGESVAIVGQNGSGKTTLVRHLNGLLRPTAGVVRVDGRDIAGERVARLAGFVGLTFQDPDRQIFAGRARVEVAFGPRNLGLRGSALEAAVADALAAVGLAGAVDANPYDLGYSRRRLLAIASVLAMRTPIVILDEPTTGQDLRGVALVREIVRRLVAEGRTVLAISHDMRFVAETFARVVVMREGRVVLDGTPAEVFAEAAWSVLSSTCLEPPLAARVGARLGLGSTPTEAALVGALSARS
jgi:energy-coupling factor transport system ATP-binding protein